MHPIWGLFLYNLALVLTFSMDNCKASCKTGERCAVAHWAPALILMLQWTLHEGGRFMMVVRTMDVWCIRSLLLRFVWNMLWGTFLLLRLGSDFNLEICAMLQFPWEEIILVPLLVVEVEST